MSDRGRRHAKARGPVRRWCRGRRLDRRRTGRRAARGRCARPARPARSPRAGGARRRTSPDRRQAKRRPCARTRTPSTQPPSRCSVASWTVTPRPSSARRGPTVTVLAWTSVASTYSGSGAEMPRPWRWPTVKACAPVCSPSTVPRRSRIAPGRAPSAPWRSRKAPWRVPARKHKSCESRLPATASPASRGELAHLRLAQGAERKAQARERFGRQRGQHVALVLADVERRAQQRARVLRRATDDARVVAGGERRRAEAVGELEHRVETHVAVAAHARVRRQAGGVVGQPAVDHTRAELRAQVDRQVWHTKLVRQLACAADRLRRAAAEIAVVLRVRPQLQRHRDRLAPGPREQQRGHRAVDPAAHRHQRPLVVAGERRPLARGGAERAMQRVRGQLGGVRLAALSPPSSARSRGAPMRAASSSGSSAHEAHRGAAGGDHQRRSRWRRSPRPRSVRPRRRRRARSRPGSDRRRRRRRRRR